MATHSRGLNQTFTATLATSSDLMLLLMSPSYPVDTRSKLITASIATGNLCVDGLHQSHLMEVLITIGIEGTGRLGETCNSSDCVT